MVNGGSSITAMLRARSPLLFLSLHTPERGRANAKRSGGSEHQPARPCGPTPRFPEREQPEFLRSVFLRTFRIHHPDLYSTQMLAKTATIIYGNRRDGAKVTGNRPFPMGSRSSDGGRCAAALLSPHCFPKPRTSRVGLFTIRGTAHGQLFGKLFEKGAEGYPRARRVCPHD